MVRSFFDINIICFDFKMNKVLMSMLRPAHFGELGEEWNSVIQGYLKQFQRYDVLKANSTNKLACLQRDWYRQAVCKQPSLYVGQASA